MSASTALSIVSLTVSLGLLFALAAFRKEFLRLEAYVRGGIGQQISSSRGSVPGELTMTGTSLVMKLDMTCISCAGARETFLREAANHPDVDFVMLTPSGRRGSFSPAADAAAASTVRHVADDDLFQSVPTAWVPALLVVDRNGTVVDAVPATDAEAVKAIVRSAQERALANN